MYWTTSPKGNIQCIHLVLAVYRGSTILTEYFLECGRKKLKNPEKIIPNVRFL